MVSEQEEDETLTALQVLSSKVESNKLVKLFPSNPIFSDSLECVSLVDIPDTNGKRSLDLDNDKSTVTNKRFKSFVYLTMRSRMGRSSKGQTQNESKNLLKFMPNWFIDIWSTLQLPLL